MHAALTGRAGPGPAEPWTLPGSALAGLGDRPLGVYVHVPFCATRCDYCDFNTYLHGDHGAFLDAVDAESRLAAATLGERRPPVGTLFFGGGTPSLIGAPAITRMVVTVDRELGLAPGAEITVECNPEDVDPRAFAELRAGGVTRISLGMQSAAAHVLNALGRRHTPGRAQAAAREAVEAGFEHVSLDLIYGMAGEEDDDWERSLDAVIAAPVDHVSLYGLIVEPGTRLHARVARGEVAAPDDGVQARRYLRAHERLVDAGLAPYEVASFARSDAAHCRHNEGYWASADWWGIGPGAHSHVAGVRWWNVLRPEGYARRLAAGGSPCAGHEVLTADQVRTERMLLGLRRTEGIDVQALAADPDGAAEQAQLGRLDATALAAGRAELTVHGRLWADAVAVALLG